MGEIIAVAIGVPLTFLLGWWGRGKWERYPWNAKPQRLQPTVTSAEALREREEPWLRAREAITASWPTGEELARSIQEAIARMHDEEDV